MNLANLLQLTPLSKLLIADRAVLADCRGVGPRRDLRAAAPYWFFQHVTACGRLRVCSPTGFIADIAPTDIEDLLPTQPLRVLAAPRTHRNEMKCDFPATVMRAFVDRWGGVDYAVQFDDPSLNTLGDRNGFSRITDADRATLLPVTNRRNMPVIRWPYREHWSCDQEARRVQASAAKQIAAFYTASITGDQVEVTKIAECGFAALSTRRTRRSHRNGTNH